MKIKDILLKLDGIQTEMSIQLNKKTSIIYQMNNESKISELLNAFLLKIEPELLNKEIKQNNLTDTNTIKNFNISFKSKENSSSKELSKNNNDQTLTNLFLNQILKDKNLIANNLKSKKSEKNLKKLKNCLTIFLKELSINIGESIDFFSNDKGKINTNKFKEILNEISDCIGIECMRLNNFSSSSREENVSIWKNKLESACQTNSNSFWNLSDLSFYKSTLVKDFKNFKSSIEDSLKRLKTEINIEELLKTNKQSWIQNLDDQIEENHARIMNNFNKFENKLEKGSINESSKNQLKLVEMDIEERASHLTGFHFLEMINHQTASKIIFFFI